MVPKDKKFVKKYKIYRNNRFYILKIKFSTIFVLFFDDSL
ncbi:hypothetical protein SAMN04488109_6865 [Chryseolinea serpens]|uniref:Uncharacterized protein n=1 Tax=Chryseolinea serpens TaxID=947013 RepID=A0A1M5XTN3_9BACT|nr:hypothetical protein SAMN04488109_6865 [Chryseolinea serpens]